MQWSKVVISTQMNGIILHTVAFTWKVICSVCWCLSLFSFQVTFWLIRLKIHNVCGTATRGLPGAVSFCNGYFSRSLTDYVWLKVSGYKTCDIKSVSRTLSLNKVQTSPNLYLSLKSHRDLYFYTHINFFNCLRPLFMTRCCFTAFLYLMGAGCVCIAFHFSRVVIKE